LSENRIGSGLHLTVPIGPSVNHYLAYRAVMKGKKAICTSYCTKEAKEYKKLIKELVTEEVSAQDWMLTPNKNQHFYVDAVFYFPRVDMDSSNYFKVLLDAITETQLIWLDDNVACERVQGVYYDYDNPRIEIWIFPVDYIGVFPDASHLEQFEAKCAGCARYTRNCSLLQKAIEGKIQPEITGEQCLKYKQKKE
jgi:Holliday junction resolvase RusA-like endonuclease